MTAAQTRCSPKVDGLSALIRTWPSNPSWTSRSLMMTWVSLALSLYSSVLFLTAHSGTGFGFLSVHFFCDGVGVGGPMYNRIMPEFLCVCSGLQIPPPYSYCITECIGISDFVCVQLPYYGCSVYLLDILTVCNETGCSDTLDQWMLYFCFDVDWYWLFELTYTVFFSLGVCVWGGGGGWGGRSKHSLTYAQGK